MLPILYKLFLLYMCMGVFPAYMSGAPEGQKRALNPPELEFQMLARCHGVLGIEPRASARVESTLNGRAISPALGHPF